MKKVHFKIKNYPNQSDPTFSFYQDQTVKIKPDLSSCNPNRSLFINNSHMYYHKRESSFQENPQNNQKTQYRFKTISCKQKHLNFVTLQKFKKYLTKNIFRTKRSKQKRPISQKSQLVTLQNAQLYLQNQKSKVQYKNTKTITADTKISFQPNPQSQLSKKLNNNLKIATKPHILLKNLKYHRKNHNRTKSNVVQQMDNNKFYTQQDYISLQKSQFNQIYQISKLLRSQNVRLRCYY